MRHSHPILRRPASPALARWMAACLAITFTLLLLMAYIARWQMAYFASHDLADIGRLPDQAAAAPQARTLARAPLAGPAAERPPAILPLHEAGRAGAVGEDTRRRIAAWAAYLRDHPELQVRISVSAGDALSFADLPPLLLRHRRLATVARLLAEDGMEAHRIVLMPNPMPDDPGQLPAPILAFETDAQ